MARRLMPVPQARLPRRGRLPVRRPPLAEHSMVRLKRALTLEDGQAMPAGALGAIVYVHAAGQAYEVEFIEPVHAVATIPAAELAQAATP